MTVHRTKAASSHFFGLFQRQPRATFAGPFEEPEKREWPNNSMIKPKLRVSSSPLDIGALPQVAYCEIISSLSLAELEKRLDDTISAAAVEGTRRIDQAIELIDEAEKMIGTISALVTTKPEDFDRWGDLQGADVTLDAAEKQLSDVEALAPCRPVRNAISTLGDTSDKYTLNSGEAGGLAGYGGGAEGILFGRVRARHADLKSLAHELRAQLTFLHEGPETPTIGSAPISENQRAQVRKALQLAHDALQAPALDHSSAMPNPESSARSGIAVSKLTAAMAALAESAPIPAAQDGPMKLEEINAEARAAADAAYSKTGLPEAFGHLFPEAMLEPYRSVVVEATYAVETYAAEPPSFPSVENGRLKLASPNDSADETPEAQAHRVATLDLASTLWSEPGLGNHVWLRNTLEATQRALGANEMPPNVIALGIQTVRLERAAARVDQDLTSELAADVKTLASEARRYLERSPEWRRYEQAAEEEAPRPPAREKEAAASAAAGLRALAVSGIMDQASANLATDIADAGEGGPEEEASPIARKSVLRLAAAAFSTLIRAAVAPIRVFATGTMKGIEKTGEYAMVLALATSIPYLAPMAAKLPSEFGFLEAGIKFITRFLS